MWRRQNIGASPSGKAAGFGPAISEVRILPPQNLKRVFDYSKTLFLVGFLIIQSLTTC